METKIETGVCPKCGGAALIRHIGDLHSGWSGGKWGEGSYTRGVISHSIICSNCGYEDSDEEIND